MQAPVLVVVERMTMHADKRLRTGPQKRGRGPVRLHDAAILVDNDDHVRYGVERFLPFPRLVGQLLFLFLGDHQRILLRRVFLTAHMVDAVGKREGQEQHLQS